MHATLTISDTDAIRKLADDLSLWRVDRRALNVELPGFDTNDNDDLKRQIALHQGTCGCGTGRFAGMATFAIYALLVVSGVLSWRALGWWRIVGLYVLASFIVTFLAKVLSLRRARAALRRIAADVELVSGDSWRRSAERYKSA
jgi:hypothetical protein